MSRISPPEPALGAARRRRPARRRGRLPPRRGRRRRSRRAPGRPRRCRRRPRRPSTSVPEAGAGTSASTLSVEISTSVSPSETASPSCLCHSRTVPSRTDSPIAGSVTCVVVFTAIPGIYSRRGFWLLAGVRSSTQHHRLGDGRHRPAIGLAVDEQHVRAGRRHRAARRRIDEQQLAPAARLDRQLDRALAAVDEVRDRRRSGSARRCRCPATAGPCARRTSCRSATSSAPCGSSAARRGTGTAACRSRTTGRGRRAARSRPGSSCC